MENKINKIKELREDVEYYRDQRDECESKGDMVG